jgi:quinol monooxygenase YgiN
VKFARNVHFQIKNGREKDFNLLFTNDVLPMLKKQDGFKQELMLVNQRVAVGISLWDDRKHAETYQATTYPKIVEKLTPVIEGTPRVETYDISATTLPV